MKQFFIIPQLTRLGSFWQHFGNGLERIAAVQSSSNPQKTYTNTCILTNGVEGVVGFNPAALTMLMNWNHSVIYQALRNQSSVRVLFRTIFELKHWEIGPGEPQFTKSYWKNAFPELILSYKSIG